MGYDRLKTRLDQGEGPLLQLDLTPQEAGEIAYRAQYPGQTPGLCGRPGEPARFDGARPVGSARAPEHRH